MCVQNLRRAKFQIPTPRGTFSDRGLNEEDGKNVRFSTKKLAISRKL